MYCKYVLMYSQPLTLAKKALEKFNECIVYIAQLRVHKVMIDMTG